MQVLRYMYTYMFVCVSIYICTYVCIYTYTELCTYIYIYKCTAYLCKTKHTNIQTHIHTYIPLDCIT